MCRTSICSGFCTLEPLPTSKLTMFVPSPAITLPTPRRFPNGLCLCALCDKGCDRVLCVQIAHVGEVSWGGPKVPYRRSPGNKFEPGMNVNLSRFELALGPLRLTLRPDPSLSLVFCPSNARAGVRRLSAGGVGRVLKLPSGECFVGNMHAPEGCNAFVFLRKPESTAFPIS